MFAAVGTPVYAALPGKVVHVTCNADPLDYGHTLILEHQTDQGVPFWTLCGHLGGSLLGLVKVGQRVSAGQLVAHLGDRHENGGWAPHSHFQIMTDLLAQTSGNFFGVGHDSLWDVWSGICIDPNLILQRAPESLTVDSNPPEVLLPRRNRSIGAFLSVFYADKLKIVRAEGAHLIDHTGRQHLDAVTRWPPWQPHPRLRLLLPMAWNISTLSAAIRGPWPLGWPCST